MVIDNFMISLPIGVAGIAGFVAFLLGWGVGFFLDSKLRSSKKIKEAEAKAEKEIKVAKDQLAEAEARMATLSVVAPDDAGLLRLKKEGGDILLELDGQKVNPSALSPDHKKRLIGLLNLMRPWLDMGPTPATASRPVAPVQASPAPAPVYSPPPTYAAPPPAYMPPPPAPKVEAKKPAPAALSIVQQIDEILQERLENTPLAKREISLHESFEGGVEVHVGAYKYAAVDEVPDEAVKSAIRAAIAEWEKKYTPG